MNYRTLSKYFKLHLAPKQIKPANMTTRILGHTLIFFLSNGMKSTLKDKRCDCLVQFVCRLFRFRHMMESVLIYRHMLLFSWAQIEE